MLSYNHFFMTRMQYMGLGHTLVSIDGAKVKVSNGEIIEVAEETVSRLRVGGFVELQETVSTEVVDDGSDDVKIQVTKKSKK
jgi:hypothetical protein